MANKYSKYSLTPYVSQYVDPQSVQVNQLLRQRYDNNKQKHDLVERSLAGIQVGGGDQYIKDNAIADINDKMANTVMVGDYENAGAIVDGIAQDFAMNEGLKLASQSYANRQAEIKAARKIEMETGRKVLDFNVVRDEETGEIIGHAFDTHQSFFQNEDGSMTRNIYHGGTELMMDYDAKKQQMLQGIAKSGSGLGPSDILGLLERWTGVSGAKADRIAEGLLEEYIATSEGQQELKKLTQIDGLSQEEAYNSIVQSMRDVAEKQVGLVPDYMKAPEQSGAGSMGMNNVMVLPGNSAIDAGMGTFEQVENEYASALNALREATSDEEKRKAQIQLANVTNKRNNMFANSLKTANEEIQNANKLRQELFSGNNAKYAAIEPLLMELVADQSFFGTDRAFGGDVKRSVYTAEGDLFTRTSFRNVRAPLLGRKGELKNLMNMLDAGIDDINDMFGTNYNEKDLENIKAVAEEYYTLFKDKGGDDLYEHYTNTAAIKTSDRIAFAPEGSTELNKVNSVLRSQLSANDFNFMKANGDIASAEEMSEIIESIGLEGGANFAGLTMPDMFTGTHEALTLNYKGQFYTVQPKEVSQAAKHLGLTARVANTLGIYEQYMSNEADYDALVHGEMTFADFNKRKTTQQLSPLVRAGFDMNTIMQMADDPMNFDVSTLPANQRSLAAMQLTNLINIENNLLSLIGVQMGESNLQTLREIESNPDHPKHNQYKSIENAFFNQQYDPKLLGL